MNVTRTAVTKLPNTRFAIAQPILRPRDEWYTERYEGICRSFVASVNTMGLDNVSKLDSMPKSSQTQTYVDNLLHLTKESSEAYVNGLLYNSDALIS